MVDYHNTYTIGEKAQHNRSILNTVIAAEQELVQTSTNPLSSALVGTDGVIQQLRDTVKAYPDEPELFVKIYLLVVSERVLDGVRCRGLEIVSEDVFFSAVGDFEENLVKYGIK